MKAAIFHGPHQPLTIENIDIDEPKGHEVLVKTMATGVGNRSGTADNRNNRFKTTGTPSGNSS